MIYIDKENKKLEITGQGSDLLIEWLMLTALLAKQFVDKDGIAGYLALFEAAAEEYERIKCRNVHIVANPIVLNLNKERFAQVKKALGIGEDVKEFYIYPKDMDKINDASIKKIMDRAKIKAIKVVEGII